MFNFLLETFLLGLKNLRLHKLRSLLTALGIILGVGAVILMVAIGEGTKRAAMQQMQQLGARNIVLRSALPVASNQASQRTSRVLDYGLRRTDLAIIESLPGLEQIVPLRNTEQKVVRGDVLAAADAVATVPEAVSVINLQPARGRFFTRLDYDNHAPVCVLGASTAKQLFPFQDPLGEQVTVGTMGRSSIPLTVVGVLEPTGLRAGAEAGGIIQLDPDRCLYFPMTIARDQFSDSVTQIKSGGMERKNIELSEIWLQAKTMGDVERISREAEQALRIGHGEKGDFEVKAPIQILRNAERQNRMFNFIIVGVSSVSLLVGGIGIMNIMLASVTERTREVGIRRALGAKRRHITLQFLIETTVISLAGGLIGIGLGAGAAILLPIILHQFGTDNYPTAIASWSIVVSFAVSGGIGIGFGLYPAVTAARMNPIEALRHE